MKKSISRSELIRFRDDLTASGAHSLVIIDDGRVLFEDYRFPYTKEDVHQLYSASKSLLSVAVGFAVQDKLLQLDSLLTEFFDSLSEDLKIVSVRHLLTMSLGKAINTDCDFLDEPDWLADSLFLSLDDRPGTVFRYDNRCSFLMSVIIQKVTGETVCDYLRRKLFTKLGMTSVTCETYQGFNPGGVGFSMTTMDLARFGQFCLQRGKWENEQILCPSWFDEAASVQIQTFSAENFLGKYKSCGYGYQFWMCPENGVYRAQGALGQICVINPHLNMVVAVTGRAADAVDLLPAVSKFFSECCPGADGLKADTVSEDTAVWEIPTEPYGNRTLSLESWEGTWTAKNEEIIKVSALIFPTRRIS